MPKNENKNGKHLMKTLKTLDYSPVGRHIKNFACIGKGFVVGAPVKQVALVEDMYDNLGELDGYLSLSTYNDNSTAIPLSGKLYYNNVTSSDAYTGLDVTTVDLTNMIGFAFDVEPKNSANLEAFKDGLASLISGNNNNNNNSNNSDTYQPVVSLAAGSLLLKDARYIGALENVACFVLPNSRVYFICTDSILYLSQDPETMISNYQQALKSSQENQKQDDNKDKK